MNIAREGMGKEDFVCFPGVRTNPLTAEGPERACLKDDDRRSTRPCKRDLRGDGNRPSRQLRRLRFRDGDLNLRNILLEFEAGLCEASTLDERPPFHYRGADERVEKAYRVICFLRECADKVTLYETDMLPYLLALLEWTYPVVAYRKASVLQKQFAAYSAGLMVSKLLEWERS